MEKDSFELATGPAGETAHCETTSQMATKTASPPLRELHDGYDASRFNALRHGVLSVHTVLPWEDKAEYEALLNALVEEYAPHGPTEEHLVEEIAGVMWRKRRLRLAEAASHRRGIKKATAPLSDTLDTALNQVERALPLEPIIDGRLSNALEDSQGSCRVEKAQCLTASRTRDFENGKTRGVQSRVSRTRRTNADIVARTTRPRARRNG